MKQIKKNKLGISKTFHEGTKKITAPVGHKAMQIELNRKFPIFPDQPKVPKIPDGYRQLTGIDISSFTLLEISWQDLQDAQVTIKLLTGEYKDEYGNTRIDMRCIDINEHTDNNLIIETTYKGIKYCKAVFELENTIGYTVYLTVILSATSIESK